MDASDRLSGQVYGNHVLSTKKYNNLSGQLESLKTQFGTSNILRDQLYEYDGNNSVTRIEDKSRNLVQTYQYDEKDQLTDMSQTLNGANTNSHYDYDGFGNMTEKSGTGSMAYNGKNQLTSLTRENGQTVSYTYDANGNQVTGGRRTVQWTPFNKASQVVRAGNVTEYQYDVNRNRAVQIVKDFDSTETTWYVGGGYEHVEVKPVRGATVEKLRFNLYAGKELIGVYVKSLTDGEKDIDKLRFFHKDALGNVDLITDISGQEVSRSLYSPFGERTQTFGNATRDETRRGFTGHEHMDSVGLINMNARLYDPETGRFLSADTFIQEPQVLLSHNRYIYVWNNPLKYTDPSGHFVNFIFGAFIALVASQFENPYIRAIGMIVGGAMMAGTIGGSGLFGAGKSVVVANKLAAGFVMGGIQGGDLKSAVLGAISAGMTYGIGHGGPDDGGLFGGFLKTATAHGVFQGIIAEARGGTFASGFASGFIGHVAGAVTGSIGGDDFASVVTSTTVAAVFGGLAAEASGGSFEQGAFQAAMVHLFNTLGKEKELPKCTPYTEGACSITAGGPEKRGNEGYAAAGHPQSAWKEAGLAGNTSNRITVGLGTQGDVFVGVIGVSVELAGRQHGNDICMDLTVCGQVGLGFHAGIGVSPTAGVENIYNAPDTVGAFGNYFGSGGAVNLSEYSVGGGTAKVGPGIGASGGLQFCETTSISCQ